LSGRFWRCRFDSCRGYDKADPEVVDLVCIKTSSCYRVYLFSAKRQLASGSLYRPEVIDTVDLLQDHLVRKAWFHFRNSIVTFIMNSTEPFLICLLNAPTVLRLHISHRKPTILNDLSWLRWND